MKILLALLLSLPVYCLSQRMALVDRNLKKPLIYADSFRTKDIFKELFPVYTDDQNTLVNALENLARNIERQVPENTTTDSIQAGNTLLINTVEVLHRRPFYSMRIKTHADGMDVFIHLFEKDNNKRNVQLKILHLADYLANDK